jgi:hypothetical protein
MKLLVTEALAGFALIAAVGLMCVGLSGCGALVAGAAGGAVAGAVIKHNNEQQQGPTYIPPRPAY